MQGLIARLETLKYREHLNRAVIDEERFFSYILAKKGALRSTKN